MPTQRQTARQQRAYLRTQERVNFWQEKVDSGVETAEVDGKEVDVASKLSAAEGDLQILADKLKYQRHDN